MNTESNYDLTKEIDRQGASNPIVEYTQIPLQNPYIRLDRFEIYGCDICPRGFLDHSSYKLHQEQCSETESTAAEAESYDLPYSPEAHIIGDIFPEIQNPYVRLDRVKIYKCNFCTRGFLDHYSFKLHEKQYLEIKRPTEDNNNIVKPYKCELCGTRFVASSTLEAHSVIHKPFPYVCECGVGYYKKCDYYTHRTLVHKEKISKDTQTKKVEKYEDYEHDHDSDINNKITKSKIGPRLKAKLTYEKPKKKNPIITENNKAKSTPKKMDLVLEPDEFGKFKCTKCPKTFTNHRIAVNHVRSHGLSCDQCSKVVKNGRALAMHKTIHNKKAVIKQFICDYCSKTIRSKMGLEIHIRTHTGEKPHACDWCPMRFNQPGPLKRHRNAHLGIKNYKCDYCEKSFVDKAGRDLHHRTHTGEKPYECKICGKMFADPSAYARHVIVHSGKKPHQCTLCPKAFADRSALIVHERRHRGLLTKTCPICHKNLSYDTQLKDHILTRHENVKKYQCDLCGKKFALKSYLFLHIQNRRNHEKRCNICNNTFGDINTLRKHALQEHNKISYECDYCGKICSRKDQLITHIAENHLQSNLTYKCKKCDKKFYVEWHLKVHMKKHLTTFICYVCKRRFNKKAQLKRHKVTGCERCPVCHNIYRSKLLKELHIIARHTDQNDKRSYKCDHCRKKYADASMLATHITKTHGELRMTCDHCQQMFRTKKAIRDHLWDRHMLSLYCSICGKRFYSQSDFGLHNNRCAAKSKRVRQG